MTLCGNMKRQSPQTFSVHASPTRNAYRTETLNEGWFGRFFEVTSAGDVVWEYVNPHFGPANETAKAQNNNVFRVYRYTEKEVARAVGCKQRIRSAVNDRIGIEPNP